MKNQDILSREDQAMIRRLGDECGVNPVSGMLDYDIRRRLCEEMADLGDGTRRLLNLLERRDFIGSLPEDVQAEYRDIMQQISHAALEGQILFMRSRAVDKDMLLAATPSDAVLQ